MHRVVCIAAFLAAVSFAAESAAAAQRRPPPLTKLELRRASPEQTRRRVLEQLSDALIVQDLSGKTGATPVRPLDDVWLYTRAYGTGTPGLCRSDMAILTFVPVGPEKGAATPVRAAGLETWRYFRLLRDVSPKEAGSLDYDGRVAANAECAAVDRMKSSFVQFVSDDGGRAAEAAYVEAIWQLRHVTSLAASGGALPFELECLGQIEGEKERCRKELAGIDPETTLLQVDVCPLLTRNGVRYSCRGYSAVDSNGRPTLDVEIYGDAPDETSKAAALVRVRESIVTIERRVD